MRKQVLEADPELTVMLTKEQRKAVHEGGRAQRAEEAPAPQATLEALAMERNVEQMEVLRREDRKRVEDLIRELNNEFGVGGGNMDLKRGKLSRAA